MLLKRPLEMQTCHLQPLQTRQPVPRCSVVLLHCDCRPLLDSLSRYVTAVSSSCGEVHDILLSKHRRRGVAKVHFVLAWRKVLLTILAARLLRIRLHQAGLD